ncbi:MAG: RNA polymerase sigma factor [Butyricimonas faecalis]
MMKEQEKMIARLYCKLRRELHTYAARYCPDEAEDIVHQAFLNGYNKIVEERNEAEQRSYLYSTVKNLCLNFIRNSRPVYMDALPDLMTEFIVVIPMITCTN